MANTEQPHEGETLKEELVEAEVVVFGGGITGLTVAHELAERNFKVVVVEPDYDPDRPHNPGLGGVARSQWCYLANDPRERDRPQSTGEVRTMEEAVTLNRAPNAATLQCVKENGTYRFVAETGASTPALLLAPLLKVMDGFKGSKLSCTVRIPGDIISTAEDFITFCLWVCNRLEGFARAVSYPLADRLRLILGRPEPIPNEFVQFDLGSKPNGDKIELTFTINAFELPGEHGFRFFPSFYRHLFGILKRIPVTDQVGEEVVRRGRDFVYDNLVAAESVGYVGDTPGPSAKFRRRGVQSQAEVARALKEFKRESGYTDADLTRLADKVWMYMTSSRLRRERECEVTSWYEFIEGDRFSPRGSYLMETTPGTLGGLFGSESDARTQGTVLLQCMMEHITSSGSSSDKLLNAPTDDAWFGHWHRYLKAQGVVFKTGKLEKFTTSASGSVIPAVQLLTPGKLDSDAHIGFVLPSKTILNTIIFVLALPLQHAHQLAYQLRELLKPEQKSEPPTDFNDLIHFVNKDPDTVKRDLTTAYPTGALRHLAGIQYFFTQDIRLWQSHTQYFDAPAGLTAVSQPQFWSISRNDVSGYRSVLSVDIGTWAKPPTRIPHPTGAWYPWGETKRSIAEHVWGQIAAAHDGDFPNAWPKLPFPHAFHIDDNLVFHPQSGVLCDDRSPFVVNEKGRFRTRPGGRAATKSPWKVCIDYDVAFDRFVLAGPFMQTYTRIYSMEAACESGCHAVNAILKKHSVRGEPCEIYDPEDHEPREMDYFKELDERLCEDGFPHMCKILDDGEIDAWRWPVEDWSDVIESWSSRKAKRNR